MEVSKVGTVCRGGHTLCTVCYMVGVRYLECQLKEVPLYYKTGNVNEYVSNINDIKGENRHFYHVNNFIR